MYRTNDDRPIFEQSLHFGCFSFIKGPKSGHGSKVGNIKHGVWVSYPFHFHHVSISQIKKGSAIAMLGLPLTAVTTRNNIERVSHGLLSKRSNLGLISFLLRHRRGYLSWALLLALPPQYLFCVSSSDSPSLSNRLSRAEQHPM